jgi:maleate isomerase
MCASIGILTPSANVVVERTAIAFARAVPGLDVLFTRVPVHGAQDPNPDGYDVAAMTDAARLLAHAKPDVIVWCGSKGLSVGLDVDRALCAAITEATGLPATTSSLALEEVAAIRPFRSVGLVTPYTAPYQARVIEGLAAMGVACAADVHGGLSDNLSYSTIDTERIRVMIAEAAQREPDAILCWCTNFASAALAAECEAAFRIPLYDATTLSFWSALRRIGASSAPAARAWGGLFEL